MSLLKYAEKVAETKSRELSERMDEEKSLLEAQRAAGETVARAREALDARQGRAEATSAELDARHKGLETREKRLKDESASLVRERTELKTLWKNLESEGPPLA